MGGNSKLQGTWVHPQVAINLAQWLSPKFAVQVSKWVYAENMIPDISEGRMFADWLRKKGYEIDNFPKYTHRYEDGRVCEAKLYPNRILNEFREHFHKVWLPERAYSYFKERDHKALPYLEEVFILNSSGERSHKTLAETTIETEDMPLNTRNLRLNNPNRH